MFYFLPLSHQVAVPGPASSLRESRRCYTLKLEVRSETWDRRGLQDPSPGGSAGRGLGGTVPEDFSVIALFRQYSMKQLS